jgi:methylaspartate ammonia-lyase
VAGAQIDGFFFRGKKWVRSLSSSENKMKSLAFTQLELMRISRPAGAKQSLQFRGASNIFNIGSIAIGQGAVFHQILHVAMRAFHIEAGFSIVCTLVSTPETSVRRISFF